MTDRKAAVGRGTIVLVGTVVAAVVAYVLFVSIPTTLTDLIGIVLVLGAAVVGARIAGGIARSAFTPYNVVEVGVDGPITREGGRAVPTTPAGTPADEIVEQIERADEDDAAEALLLRLNTPGGQIVPSDDIRNAAEAFDGPTVAYTTDVCASGGYWIASGCDELWAREGSLVGSIGVIGSRVNASELADRIGLSYEQLTAGEYKDAGSPLKEFEQKDREYLQGLIDDYYDHFVERVSEGRGLDAESVRETEAQIFLGGEAHERGLVDKLGDREAVEDALSERLDITEVVVEEFVPERPLMAKLSGGTARIAHAAGAGAASVFTARDGFEFR